MLSYLLLNPFNINFFRVNLIGIKTVGWMNVEFNTDIFKVLQILRREHFDIFKP